jgi:hypothetical protein
MNTPLSKKQRGAESIGAAPLLHVKSRGLAPDRFTQISLGQGRLRKVKVGAATPAAWRSSPPSAPPRPLVEPFGDGVAPDITTKLIRP